MTATTSAPVKPVPATGLALVYVDLRDPPALVLSGDGVGPERRPLDRLGVQPYITWVRGIAPNGEMVAWSDGVTGKLQIARWDGTGRVEVNTELQYGCGMTWSPDSRQVAFTSRKGDAMQIQIVNADGTGLRTVDTQGGCWPTWSVDGSRLAYITGGLGARQAVTISPDGTGRRVVPATLPAHKEVRSILSVSADGHAVVGLRSAGHCGCDDGERWYVVDDASILDLNDGSLTPLTDPRGTVMAALYRPRGGMVMRVNTSTERGDSLLVVVNDAAGHQQATWREPFPPIDLVILRDN